MGDPPQDKAILRRHHLASSQPTCAGAREEFEVIEIQVIGLVFAARHPGAWRASGHDDAAEKNALP